AYPVKKLSRLLRPHPITRVQLVARGGHSQKMSQVAGQRRHAEPANRERVVRAALYTSQSFRLSPWIERPEIYYGCFIKFIPYLDCRLRSYLGDSPCLYHQENVDANGLHECLVKK